MSCATANFSAKIFCQDSSPLSKDKPASPITVAAAAPNETAMLPLSPQMKRIIPSCKQASLRTDEMRARLTVRQGLTWDTLQDFRLPQPHLAPMTARNQTRNLSLGARAPPQMRASRILWYQADPFTWPTERASRVSSLACKCCRCCQSLTKSLI